MKVKLVDTPFPVFIRSDFRPFLSPGRGLEVAKPGRGELDWPLDLYIVIYPFVSQL